MKVKWDVSELTNFAKSLADIHEFDGAMMAATRKVARVLHQYLINQTPVVTGNLRKMWSAGDNIKFIVDKVGDGFEVTFVNTARANSADGFMYGLAVNDGHASPNGSWVMGRFFVERAILQTEGNSQIEQMIMNELQKWWEECFNG